MKLAHALFGCIAFSISTGVANAQRELPTVTVQAPSEAVIGLPLPVEVQVEARGQLVLVMPNLMERVSEFTFLLVADDATFGFNRCVLRHARQKRPTTPDHGPRSTQGYPRPRFDIAPGVSTTFVTELTNLDTMVQGGDDALADPISPDAIPPGTYELRVHYGGEYVDRLEQTPTVTLVAPNAEELRLIERLRKLGGYEQRYQRTEDGRLTASLINVDGPLWRQFVVHAEELLEGIDLDKFSEAGRRQVSMYVLMASLVHDSKPIAELTISPELTENLWPGYRTEVLKLRYEIATVSGRADHAASLLDEILRLQPTAAQDLRRMTKLNMSLGGSIKNTREQVAEQERRDADKSR